MTIDPVRLASAFGLVGAMLVAPLWLTALPPMTDFPAHVATLFIQIKAAPNSVLRHIYEVDWGLIPDLASELIVPLFAAVMPVIPATKLFMSIAVLLWVCGPAAVQYALFRRIGVTALLGAFVAYNRNFITGFINYYFAAGVAFFVIAAWIASAQRPAWLRLAMLTVSFSVLYFLHLLALAFAGFFCWFSNWGRSPAKSGAKRSATLS